MSKFEMLMAFTAFSVWGIVCGMWLHYYFGHSLADDEKHHRHCYKGEGYDDVQQLPKSD